MTLSNTPSAVVLRVTGAVTPPPMFVVPQVIGPNLLLTWSATPSTVYRVEFSSDLNPINWNPLPVDVTTTSNTASKLDPLTTSNRFYRVRVLP
jgi:hypothetical protein